MGRRSWGDSFILGGIVKILEMEERGLSGKTDDTGGGGGHIWKNPNSKRSVTVCVSRALMLLSPDPNGAPRRHVQTLSI